MTPMSAMTPNTPMNINLDGFDLRHLPAGFTDNPYPWYAALRSESPVRRMPDGSVFLTRYRDLELVYKNPKIFSSDKKQEFLPKFGQSPLYDHHTTSLVFNDPPLHTRVRKILMGALTPKAIGQMEAGLVQLVDRLLDQLVVDARGGSAVDLIAGFASAIPVEVIGNLLGVPHNERGPLRDWSLAILGALEPSLSEAQLHRGNTAVAEFLAYLRGLVAQRRVALGDPQTDVLTRLILGEGGTGELLSEEELLQNCIFILNAGHETTTNLIGNGMLALLTNRDQLTALRSQPDLIGPAIEEILRYDGPARATVRMVKEEHEVGGRLLKPGERVFLVNLSANRDPDAYPDPDTLDIRRNPGNHLGFGVGIHYCLGAPLARLEGQLAITRLLDAFPAIDLDAEPSTLAWHGTMLSRGLVSLPVSLTD